MGVDTFGGLDVNRQIFTGGKDGRDENILLLIPGLQFEDRQNDMSPLREGTWGVSPSSDGGDAPGVAAGG